MKIPGLKYRAVLSATVSATCRLDGDATGATLYYPRYTRLGAKLLSNAGSERQVLANYIRQEKGWPRGEANATPISFVGV